MPLSSHALLRAELVGLLLEVGGALDLESAEDRPAVDDEGRRKTKFPRSSASARGPG
jgi:hypothetical protein